MCTVHMYAVTAKSQVSKTGRAERMVTCGFIYGFTAYRKVQLQATYSTALTAVWHTARLTFILHFRLYNQGCSRRSVPTSNDADSLFCSLAHKSFTPRGEGSWTD
jgi:hypothetical protein